MYSFIQLPAILSLLSLATAYNRFSPFDSDSDMLTGAGTGTGAGTIIRPGPLCTTHYILPAEDNQCLKVVAKFPDMGYGQQGLNNFYAWNPQIDRNCRNLQVGQSYCVGSVNLDIVCRRQY
ncbi:hypothetical protein N7456_002122 [Penicillium angulare]|uniref:LysM domain-containing protein n=1 Tax=Penicillium angulare TaxID=116970 RepID=A0A9W9G7N5_9EURO|nr:hypothetical protein N7456_002122 [Penicillium angulare]